MLPQPPTPAAAAALPAPDDLLRAVVDTSLTGLILFQPMYAPHNPAEMVDLAYVQLNPAAQRMLQLPEHPANTFLTLYPNAREAGIFAFYRTTFLSGEPARYDVNYQHDGLDNYFQLAGRRVGELLLVSFSDTRDQPRTAVEVALRASQAAEQAARADAEAQRQRFYEVLLQVPAQVATYHGPDHVFSFVNPRYQAYFPDQALRGRPLREALPEALAQGFVGLLNHVFQTGEPYYSPEQEFWLGSAGTGPPEQLFLNAFFCPLRDAQGRIDGLLDFSYDVTEQVRARRQVEQLNQQLEERVQERTHETQAARAQAEWQRARLEQFFMQAPAAICVFDGPDFRYELVNPAYQALFAGRPQLGLTLLDALPELAGQRALRTLQQVYDTGQTHREAGVLVRLARPGDGQLEDRYFDYIQQARR
ncbi:PAS domain-containing protein [Hymenobacter sp. GOD-10R]|uniref:PAS domain-containing protein n=1 Tax=Hymenobacter sp. GOD-10R TaxID=3093922 RepID=UPI002D795453|nr:PAS domain-containing protein [Hymenobacter sp. GOD-10R]WRQ31783.1 PAS domain-containing protein [Hymenobacter sp. GOD-10R]